MEFLVDGLGFHKVQTVRVRARRDCEVWMEQRMPRNVFVDGNETKVQIDQVMDLETFSENGTEFKVRTQLHPTISSLNDSETIFEAQFPFHLRYGTPNLIGRDSFLLKSPVAHLHCNGNESLLESDPQIVFLPVGFLRSQTDVTWITILFSCLGFLFVLFSTIKAYSRTQ